MSLSIWIVINIVVTIWFINQATVHKANIPAKIIISILGMFIALPLVYLIFVFSNFDKEKE